MVKEGSKSVAYSKRKRDMLFRPFVYSGSSTLRFLFLPRNNLLRLPLVYRFVYLRLPFTRLEGKPVNEIRFH